LPFTLKRYLEAKEELWKFKYLTMQKYKSSKKSSKETKSLQHKIFKPTQNPILMCVENNNPFLPCSLILLTFSQTYQTLIHIERVVHSS
jgi:hypothetical protein